jgi:hypothetical protein
MIQHKANVCGGHAMTQVVNHWPFTTEGWVHARISPCGICGRQIGTGTSLCLEFFSFPVSIIPPWPQFRDIVSPQQHEHKHEQQQMFVVDGLLWNNYLIYRYVS